MAESGEVEYVPLLSGPESDGEEEEPPTVSVQSVPENGGKPSNPCELFGSVHTNNNVYISRIYPPCRISFECHSSPLVGGRWSHVGNLDEFFTRVSSAHGRTIRTVTMEHTTHGSSCTGVLVVVYALDSCMRSNASAVASWYEPK